MMDHPLFDLHTHTIASGHASTCTITDMAKAARKKGLTTLGVTDHGPATPGGAKPSYFRNLAYAPKVRCGVNMLYGVELNILDYNGRIDLEDEILDQLDYGIASMHLTNIKPGTVEQNTNAYIRAMQHKNVKIIGHWDDARYPVDHQKLLAAAADHHVLLEINNGSLRPDGYRGDTRQSNKTMLALLKQAGYPILLSSDSHGSEHIGDFQYAMALIRETGFPQELTLGVGNVRQHSC